MKNIWLETHITEIWVLSNNKKNIIDYLIIRKIL